MKHRGVQILSAESFERRPFLGTATGPAANSSSSSATATAPDGKVLSWGENAKFQLGRMSGGLRLPHPPALVEGLEGIVEITASENTTCARTKDGAVAC